MSFRLSGDIPLLDLIPTALALPSFLSSVCAQSTYSTDRKPCASLEHMGAQAEEAVHGMDRSRTGSNRVYSTILFDWTHINEASTLLAQAEASAVVAE